MRLIVVIIAALFLVGCGGENQAKNIAENYMNAVKNGDEFEHIISSDEFIDLFDYEYLQTLEETEEKDTRGIYYDLWEISYGPGTEFPTFENYKKRELEYIESSPRDFEIIRNDDEALEYWDGESTYKVYTFLYNVEIADEEGQKLYKKAEITVREGLVRDGDDYKDGYYITDIYLR